MSAPGTFVVGDNAVWSIDGPPGWCFDRPPAHVGELAQTFAPGSVVHVHPSGHRWVGLPARWPKLVGDRRAHPWLVDAAAAGFELERGPDLGWHVPVRNGDRRWWVVVDEWSTLAAGPWAIAGSAREAAAALALFRRVVGFGWRSTVGKTAEQLIASTHPRSKGGVQLPADPRIPHAIGNAELEGPWDWHRSPHAAVPDSEAGASWLHVFDVNAQYLAPWQGLELGVGDLVHAANDRTGVEIDLSMPGFWRTVNPLPADKLGRELLPTAWLPNRSVYSSATIRRAIELGMAPVAAEGWWWPDHTRYLRAAGQRLSGARTALLEQEGPTAELVRAAIKMLYAVFVGRVSTERDEVVAAESRWRRGDWGNLIRATARVNLHRKLERTWREHGIAPIAARTDTVGYLSAEPDPLAFASAAALPVGPQLGAFKVVRTVHVDELQRDPAMSALQLFKAAKVVTG